MLIARLQRTSIVLCAVALLTTAALAQQPAGGRYRQLAPGVETFAAPVTHPNETHSRHDVVELLKVDPTFDWAKGIRFEHPIWALEFYYKPVRFVTVDVPDAEGKLHRKRVWYMVYRVRNPGTEPVEFNPWFVLESKDPKFPKAYPDRLVPMAMPAIVAREDKNRPLKNTVEIAGTIAPSSEGENHSVWGVATWTDIDPRIDQFAIYVSGLTNAYRWKDSDAGREFSRKKLELNFWRPGDEHHEHEAEIRPGGPDKVDYRWVYR
jgi:hypothetical protein